MNQDNDLERPSNARYGVLTYLCTLAFVLYIDRICIAKAGPSMQKDLDLSNTQMGFVYASFTLAYALFEVWTGRLGDRFGSRQVLIRIVLWWSAFTALTGAAFKMSWDTGYYTINLGLIALMLIRFLFGAGEAGAIPNMARVLSCWFPQSSRGRAQSLITTSTLVGGAIAPIAAALLIEAFGWRWSFMIFGILGVVWAAAFAGWFRDDPARHPSVNPAELHLIRSGGTQTGETHQPIPWGRVFQTPVLWLLGGVITCTAFLTYMFFAWLPTYLEKGRGVASMDAGWLAGLVLGGGAVGALLGGALNDYLVHRFSSRNWTRRWMGFFSLSTAALCVAACPMVEDAWVSSVLLASASFLAHIALPCWWMTVIEITGKHVGALFGLLNSLGAVGAVTSQLFLGWYTDYRKDLGFEGRDQWDPAFWIYAGVLSVGALGWLIINPTTTLEPPHQELPTDLETRIQEADQGFRPPSSGTGIKDLHRKPGHPTDERIQE